MQLPLNAIEALLSGGADGRARNGKGETPRDLAAKHKKQAATKLLEEWEEDHPASEAGRGKGPEMAAGEDEGPDEPKALFDRHNRRVLGPRKRKRARPLASQEEKSDDAPRPQEDAEGEPNQEDCPGNAPEQVVTKEEAGDKPSQGEKTNAAPMGEV